MKPSDYEFNIGDKVITTFGEVGEIVDICKCEHCVKRGFHEPVWVDEYGNKHWIGSYMAEHGFDMFYQIGKYKFDNVLNVGYVEREIARYEDLAARWKKRQKVLEELAKERKEA